MRNIIFTFGILCFCSLVLFEMGKVAIIKKTVPIELLMGTIAGVFLVAGLLLARRQAQAPTAETAIQTTPETTIVTANESQSLRKINELNISRREYEILCEVALGLSNSEIAQKLFVSESTVKTHISNLLPKLNARRRTEAVRVAKELNIIN